jgi:16S rRNA G527 N7-methylase RsmG
MERVTIEDERLQRLAELIASSPHNLVSPRERDHVLEGHIGESLAVASAITGLVEAGAAWVDLGTGGGLPGLVLAIAYPATTWTLIDAVEKKAAAVRSFAQELNIENVRVIAERAETAAHDPLLRGRARGVVARARERLQGKVLIPPAVHRLRRPGYVAVLGWRRLQQGQRVAGRGPDQRIDHDIARRG